MDKLMEHLTCFCQKCHLSCTCVLQTIDIIAATHAEANVSSSLCRVNVGKTRMKDNQPVGRFGLVSSNEYRKPILIGWLRFSYVQHGKNY